MKLIDNLAIARKAHQIGPYSIERLEKRVRGMYESLEALTEEATDTDALQELRYNFFGFARLAEVLGYESMANISWTGERQCSLAHVKRETPNLKKLNYWKSCTIAVDEELTKYTQSFETSMPGVLFVTDDDDSHLFRELTTAGLDYDIARDVETVKQRLEDHSYVACIVDLNSETYSVSEIIYQVNTFSDNHNTPVIALSDNLGDSSDAIGPSVELMIDYNADSEDLYQIIKNLLKEVEHVRGTIFVADASTSTRSKLELDLELDHFKVIGFDNALETLGRLSREVPDVLLLGSVGKQEEIRAFARRIKNNKRFSKTVLIMLTKETDANTRQSIFKAGADDYIMLPYLPEELVARIHERLDYKRLSRMIHEFDVEMSYAPDISGTPFGDRNKGVGRGSGNIFTPRRNKPEGEPVRVLIADEDILLRNMLSYHFKKAGWEVELAQNGEEVTEHLTNKQFDLVLMDIYLTFKNGFEILLWIRENGLNRQLKTIVMTAQNQDETASRAFSLGANEFLTKPFAPDNVINRINNILQAV